MAEDTRWHVKLEHLVLSVGFSVTESNLSGGKEKVGPHTRIHSEEKPSASII